MSTYNFKFIEQIELMVSPTDSQMFNVCVEVTGDVFVNDFGVRGSEFNDCEITELNFTLKCGEDITDKVESDDAEWNRVFDKAEELLLEKTVRGE